MNETNKLILFQGQNIRRIFHNDEWWFSVVDVVTALTDSADPKQYIKKMKSRDNELNVKWGTICTPLRIQTPDGKMRESSCANTEGLFRIIQSIPSPKAEPFKLWLAKVGYERMQDIFKTKGLRQYKPLQFLQQFRVLFSLFYFSTGAIAQRRNPFRA